MAEATAAVSTEQAIKEEDIPGAIASLKAQIPLLPDQRKLSDDSILRAMYQEADAFAHTLENDTAAIHVLESMLARFPGNSLQAESYYRLSLLYSRLGDEARAAYYRDHVLNQFGNSRFAAALRGPVSTDTIPVLTKATTALYTQAYLDYLSGDYDQVLKLKDGAMHLDPQNAQQARFDLLAAMVTVKQQSDSAGKAALQGVILRQKADTAIVGEAAAMLDALNHKQALIEHLAQLQLPEESENQPPAPSQYRPATPADTMTAVSPPVAVAPVADTLKAQIPADTVQTVPVPKPPAVTPYKLSADQPHFVVLAFNRTDKRLIDECLNRFSAYNQKIHPAEKIEVSSFLLAQNQVILIFRLFSSEAPALLYYQEIKGKSATTIIPDIPASYYHFFIISRDNFILLNNTKDYAGYMQFFTQNFR
jgi:tetratricopeptide (TPR) repeat protein